MSLITDALQKSRRPIPAWEPPLPLPSRTPEPEPSRPAPFVTGPAPLTGPAGLPESGGGPPSQHPWWPAVLALWIIGLTVLLFWPQKTPQASFREATRGRRSAPAPIAPEPLQFPKPIAAMIPPMPSAPPPIMAMSPLAWKVDGVIVGMGTPTAIINGKVVEEGQEILGAKVVSVSTDRVELLHHGELIEVAVEGP